MTDDSLRAAQAALETAAWRRATRLRQFPHAYTLRRAWTDDAAFVAVVQTIRQYGYDALWWRKRYRYLDLGAYTNWTMGEPLEQTTLINRRARRPRDGTRLQEGV
ncbi:MAG TPA: hypothetical protein VK066_17870 [Chloroflexota bacterium]|nr:hypothetical protein [Chloroflexota bacterium]